MRRDHSIRRRLAQIRASAEAFETVNFEQGHLKGLVLSIIGFVDRARCHGRELERWWRVAEEYRRALDSPRLAGKGRQTFLRQVVG